VLGCVLASLFVPALASASTGLYAVTRVRGVDLGNPASLRTDRAVTLGTHKGCGLEYDDFASDSLLAARGADELVDLTTAARRRHILDGDVTGGGHRAGTGIPGKSEFPASWSDDAIIHEISDIATDPAAIRTGLPGGRTLVDGTRNGVDIRVVLGPDGSIVTGFPTNVPRNP